MICYTVNMELRCYRQVEIYSDEQLSTSDIESLARREATSQYGAYDEYEIVDIDESEYE